MYRLPEKGYTVSITKEKFLNTYPPLFSTSLICRVRWAGYFFAVIHLSGFMAAQTRTGAQRMILKR